MADVVTPKLTARLEARQTRSTPGGTMTLPAQVQAVLSWANGNGSEEANELYHASGSISAGNHLNIDLTDVDQKDDDGDDVRTGITFAGGVKAVIVVNTTAVATGGKIQVGGGTDGAGAADAWAGSDCLQTTDDGITDIPAGGFLFWCNPQATGGPVSDGTADELHLGAVTQDQTYEIMIIGDAS